MTTPSSKAFTPVSLSADQAVKLETLMEKQVQDAILAHSVQVAKDHELDSDWRFVGSISQLKTFKLRGSDPLSSTSSWATTLEKITRATACNLNEFTSTDKHSHNRRWTHHGKFPATRQTVGDPCGHRDSLDPRSPVQSFRTFGRVQGNYRDIIGVHHAVNSADFVQQQKLLSPMVIDGAVLRTIRATKENYFGIKWLAENSFSGKRDICFVEMVDYTILKGQEIGFVAFASVDVPECPELGCLKLKRVRMKRTMLVIPTTDVPETTSEVFVMGISEAPYIGNTRYRLNMAVLNDISLVIDSHNITRQSLALHKDWVPDENRPLCTICSRIFHFISRRRHHCRMCGDVVCKTCYVKRSVRREKVGKSQDGRPRDASAICQTKFCLRCIVSLRAIDKRLDNFSPQVSKMLSLNVDPLNASATVTFEEFIELDSPDSNPACLLILHVLQRHSRST